MLITGLALVGYALCAQKMNLTRYFSKLAALDPKEHAKPVPATTRRQSAKSIAAAEAKAAVEAAKDIKKLRAAILLRLNQSMEGSK